MSAENKRAFLAVVLSGVVLFSWQYFFGTQEMSQQIGSDAEKSAMIKEVAAPVVTQVKVVKSEVKPVQAVVNFKTTQFENKKVNIIINQNFGLVDFKNINQKFDFSTVVGDNLPLVVQVIDENTVKHLTFDIINDGNKFSGVDNTLGVNLSGELLDNGKLNFHLTSAKKYRYRIQLKSSKKELENRQIRQFIYFGQDIERENVGDDFSYDGIGKWVGIDFNFHLLSLMFAKKETVRIVGQQNGILTVDTVHAAPVFAGSIVFTKKNYDDLVVLGDKLELAVDFGILGIMAVPILRALQWIYKILPNYGIAIILLTLLMRLITFPLQYKSFKSMKKMQIIQPELAALKEKFKDDPKRQQAETMNLFKKAGANPLGGCLPLIIQMPVFFAFYRVLYGAVELVEAPFYFWITDLSIKDPFYVLPVLMGLAMLLQQKYTPSASIDPNQKKIMMIMPLVFTFIMKDLPAGLNLYIFVSTIFGVAQQLLVYRTTD